MTSRISSPRTYDGVIARQGLIDYCQGTAEKMYAELLREEAILEKDGNTMSDSQYETLTFSKQNIIGHIAALREIGEWAKVQVEKDREAYGSQEDLKNKYDGVKNGI